MNDTLTNILYKIVRLKLSKSNSAKLSVFVISDPIQQCDMHSKIWKDIELVMSRDENTRVFVFFRVRSVQ